MFLLLDQGYDHGKTKVECTNNEADGGYRQRGILDSQCVAEVEDQAEAYVNNRGQDQEETPEAAKKEEFNEFRASHLRVC